eukprot:COSAG01_NODE_29270_length_641_cov_1.234317_1_plen_50_part_01
MEALPLRAGRANCMSNMSETLGGVWGSPSRRYYKILGGPPNTRIGSMTAH